MNKIIPFNKDITFNDRIGEIESIALDDTLKFVNPHNIKGELIVRGCHKVDDLHDDFSYPMPVDITVDDKYDTKKASISIDDFYYEIINNNILRVKIDLLLDDLYYQEEIPVKEEREVVMEKQEETLEVNNIAEEKNLNTDSKEEKKSDVLDLFKETSNDKEYSIYRVYVVVENETLDDILNKYKVTKEDLEDYNDLSNIKPGVKLIIPSTDE